MKKISILCPSRQRCNTAVGYCESVFKMANHPERVELLFYLDRDDPELALYKVGFKAPPDFDKRFVNGVSGPTHNIYTIPGHKNIKLIVGDPKSVSESWNDLARVCTGDILLMGNDDLIHETRGWDDVLDNEASKYPNEFYCIFFNDGINHGKHCAFPAVSRVWYDTLGYFTPGIFEFLYNDTWIFDIAKRLDTVHYVPKVMVRHNHWTVTKQKDATTKRHRDDNPGRKKRDEYLYNQTGHIREQAAEKIRCIMSGHLKSNV